jgi:hypothetical protein
VQRRPCTTETLDDYDPPVTVNHQRDHKVTQPERGRAIPALRPVGAENLVYVMRPAGIR